MRAIAIALFIVWSGMSLGCMSEPTIPSAAPAPARGAVNAPPRQVFEDVKRALQDEPGITEDRDGVIVTGWERHPGNWHIGRRWQERTRYRISIIPDWNEPAAKGRIEVAAETEQRAAEGQRWDPAPSVHRPERAEALLQRLMQGLRK